MNGASIFMLIVLAAALCLGMGFMVGELNRNAEEILADRQTIQDLQAALEVAHAAAVQQQHTVDQLNAALDQQAARLEQVHQTLQSAQSDADGMRQAFLDEQAARAAAEQQAAALSGQVQILQNRTVDLEAQMNHLYQEKHRLEQQISQHPSSQLQIPLTGAAQSSSPIFSYAVPFASLVLVGGGAAWLKRKSA